MSRCCLGKGWVGGYGRLGWELGGTALYDEDEPLAHERVLGWVLYSIGTGIVRFASGFDLLWERY